MLMHIIMFLLLAVSPTTAAEIVVDTALYGQYGQPKAIVLYIS